MPFVSCSKFNQSQATQDQAIADLAQELLNKQNALNDCSGNPLAGTVPTCAQMTTAIQTAIDALPADKYLQGLKSYNPATNTMTLLMSDGSTVPVDMTQLIADAVGGGTSPTGAAGGDLQGTYPNPTVVPASTTKAGKVELATNAETIAGTSTNTVVTPAGLKAVTDSLSLPTDTYTFAGSGRPTGAPVNNGGSSYAQNAEGEMFLYSGTEWVLIGNGAFKEVFQTHSPVIVIPDSVATNTLIYQYIAPRAGVILVSCMIVGSVSDARMTSPSRMSVEATLARDGVILHRFESSLSYYGAGDGIRASGSALLAVNQGTVLTLGCNMNEVSGSTDTFRVDTSGFSTLYVQ